MKQYYQMIDPFDLKIVIYFLDTSFLTLKNLKKKVNLVLE